MGRNLNEDNLNKSFCSIREMEKNNKMMKLHRNITVELMCHPGNVPNEFYWDDFNCSQERLYGGPCERRSPHTQTPYGKIAPSPRGRSIRR